MTPLSRLKYLFSILIALRLCANDTLHEKIESNISARKSFDDGLRVYLSDSFPPRNERRDLETAAYIYLFIASQLITRTACDLRTDANPRNAFSSSRNYDGDRVTRTLHLMLNMSQYIHLFFFFFFYVVATFFLA